MTDGHMGTGYYEKKSLVKWERETMAKRVPSSGLRESGRPRQQQRPTATLSHSQGLGPPPHPGQQPQPLRGHQPALQTKAAPWLG